MDILHHFNHNVICPHTLNDGIADSGQFVAFQGMNSTPAFSGACTADTMLSGNSADYDLSDETIGCAMGFWLD